MRQRFIRLTPMIATKSTDLVVNVRSIRSVWIYNGGEFSGTRILLAGENDPWCIQETPDEVLARIKKADLT